MQAASKQRNPITIHFHHHEFDLQTLVVVTATSNVTLDFRQQQQASKQLAAG